MRFYIRIRQIALPRFLPELLVISKFQHYFRMGYYYILKNPNLIISINSLSYLVECLF